ncbi:winged helix-turn-helix domain-containing protein [Streptomyces sp. NBC_00257]|uniref:ArsR/SmtB family transcription factor n=1 Tax=unclassified Streptomyces TaxID=2593676 RepID=UPI0022525278|nr:MULTISPECIES: winged helix-turn-helix domain-containing protein [unclassified Streptomyces]MCX4398642.1 winged helix-turn-helix domain-containing protein [Streptomyces sp. NBC_01767]MCX4871025.1 winged helix-turn-helix domain-containing protein [Streptomyces sp. NBC_00906]MCX4901765.1 winged helix-turn-helix domain-containing protein [Streptomyces sp. NBC_00892]MCX5427007.1 winged helix-turn-helix domain-containing protein [Streptomyces sp. NBC_00062]WSP52211.1 winged helix-turn-helix domai
MDCMNTRRAHATGPDLASVARLLADGTRAAFCLALLDGRAWTATELARHARVAPSTATEHLHALVRGNLLAEERQGRHRYVRLVGLHVAELIESLAAMAPHRAPAPRSLSAVGRRQALAHARTCYDQDGHGSSGAFFVIHMTMCDPFHAKVIGTLRGVPSVLGDVGRTRHVAGRQLLLIGRFGTSMTSFGCVVRFLLLSAVARPVRR